jgi:hypothetical protein
MTKFAFYGRVSTEDQQDPESPSPREDGSSPARVPSSRRAAE